MEEEDMQDDEISFANEASNTNGDDPQLYAFFEDSVIAEANINQQPIEDPFPPDPQSQIVEQCSVTVSSEEAPLDIPSVLTENIGDVPAILNNEPSSGTNVSDFKFQHSADGYHYYIDDAGAWYAQDDAGYWYYQEMDGNFKLWDTQNVDSQGTKAEDGDVSATGELNNIETPILEVNGENKENAEVKEPDPIVLLDENGRPQYPKGSDGRPVLPIGPDGKKVFPMGKDNKPLFPVDDDGTPIFPIADDGQPVFPIGPQNKPIVPVDKNGRPVFPLGNDGMPIFPLGPDGKPTAPVTISDLKPVLPVDQNGKPIVPYGPDGQPLIHVGPDGTPIEGHVAAGQAAVPPGDYNQYWAQYYQYYNQYYSGYYNNPYSMYPPPTAAAAAPVTAGYPPSYGNHSYVGFGSGFKKSKVRPEDIDLPAGPAPPIETKMAVDNNVSQQPLFGSAKPIDHFGSTSSPINSNFNDSTNFEKKESATKMLLSKQIKMLATYKNFKKESELERTSSAGSLETTKSKVDMYGPLAPPAPTHPSPDSSLPSSAPKFDLASVQKFSNEPSAPGRNRWEPPPPGTQEIVSKISPALKPMTRERSRSKSRSRSHHSRSKSRSTSRERVKRRRSRSRSHSPRSRSRSPFRGDRDRDRNYRSGFRGRSNYRDDRWGRGGGGWRNRDGGGGRYSRFSPRGPPGRQQRDRWRRSPTPERRRRRSRDRAVDRKSKSPSQTRSYSRSSSKSEKSKERVSRSPTPGKPEHNHESLHKSADYQERKSQDEKSVVNVSSPMDYQPDEPMDDEHSQQRAVATNVPIIDESTIKVIDRNDQEVEWSQRLIIETRTVPLLSYSCKPDMYDSFVVLKQEFDAKQKSQPPKAKQEQDAILQPHKPISFGLVKLEATHVQRTSVDNSTDQSSKWKPLGADAEPVNESVEEESPPTKSKSKKRKKGELKVDPELENLRHAALVSMEKAQKDLAYYESIVKAESDENDESFLMKTPEKKHRKRKAKKQKKQEVEDNSDDGSMSSGEEKSKKKRASISKKKHSKKQMKKPKKKRHDESSDEEESANEESENSSDSATPKVNKHRKKKRSKRSDSSESDSSDEDKPKRGNKHKKPTRRKRAHEEASSDEMSEKEKQKSSRSSVKKVEGRRDSQPSSDKGKPSRINDESFVEQEAGRRRTTSEKSADRKSDDKNAKKKKKGKGKKKASKKKVKRKLRGSSSSSSSIDDDGAAKSEEDLDGGKRKRSKMDSSLVKQSEFSWDVRPPNEIGRNIPPAEPPKENQPQQSWMPKMHEVFLPSNSYSKSKDIFDMMKDDNNGGVPPPPPPKEKRKKISSARKSSNSPPPPPPPFPRRESQTKSILLSPSKLTSTLQQPVLVPVATYRPVSAGVQQYPPPPPTTGYPNVKYQSNR